MEIIEGSFSERDEIYNKAYRAKVYLDTKPNLYHRKEAGKHWKAFLNDKKECPTRANIALQKVIHKESLYYPQFFEQHKNDLSRNNPKIDMLIKEIDEIETKNYPKTREIRKKLIENNRFTTNFVTSKLSAIQKILIKIKFIF